MFDVENFKKRVREAESDMVFDSYVYQARHFNPIDEESCLKHDILKIEILCRLAVYDEIKNKFQ